MSGFGTMPFQKVLENDPEHVGKGAFFTAMG
jgi:hypothetical protein